MEKTEAKLWRIDPMSDGETTAIETVDGEHMCLIQHEDDERDHALAEKVARRIITAVNSHDELVEACKTALSELEFLIECINTKSDVFVEKGSSVDRGVQKIRSALKSAQIEDRP